MSGQGGRCRRSVRVSGGASKSSGQSRASGSPVTVSPWCHDRLSGQSRNAIVKLFKARKAQAAGGADAMVQRPDDRGRSAPEPLTLMLPAFAALGAIASIAAVAYGDAAPPSERTRARRRADAVLRDLETSALGTAEILRRICVNARRLGLDGPAAGAPMKLGLTSGRVQPDGSDLYLRLVNDLATMLVLATQASFEAVHAIEDGEIDAPEDVFHAFADAQERLNGLLTQRAAVRPMTEGCRAVANDLAGLIGKLRRHDGGRGG